MPNHTVSGNVDTMLRAADNAAIRSAIGVGQTDVPAFAGLALTSPTLTASTPTTIDQTWNNVAVPFTALKVNATNTASAAASNLLDLQVGGVSKFNVDKNGGVTSNANFFIGGLNIGNAIGMSVAGGHIRALNGIAINLGSADSSSTDNFANLFLRASAVISLGGETKLFSDAAGVLAQRNGVNAQAFRVYGTWTSASVFERLSLKYNSAASAFQIGTEQSGLTVRPLEFQTNGVTRCTIDIAGSVGIGTTAPASKLTVTGGDAEVTDATKGVILKSPDGTRYRVTVANGGILTVAAV